MGTTTKTLTGLVFEFWNAIIINYLVDSSSLRKMSLRSVTATVLRPLVPVIQSQHLVRWNRKSRLYGFEEGHDLKNEVRKDKWIRKKKVRMVGATFRKNSDLPPNAFASFGLSRQPDWSFADGTPGYLSKDQREAVEVMEELNSQVHRALKFMNKTSSTSGTGKAEV